jgi:hypothetical protein
MNIAIKGEKAQMLDNHDSRAWLVTVTRGFKIKPENGKIEVTVLVSNLSFCQQRQINKNYTL